MPSVYRRLVGGRIPVHLSGLRHSIFSPAHHCSYNPVMSDDRKSHVWPWIAALLVGLPITYVVSFGPACFLGHKNVISARAIKMTYRPIIAAMDDGPLSVQCALYWYGGFGRKPTYLELDLPREP